MYNFTGLNPLQLVYEKTNVSCTRVDLTFPNENTVRITGNIRSIIRNTSIRENSEICVITMIWNNYHISMISQLLSQRRMDLSHTCNPVGNNYNWKGRRNGIGFYIYKTICFGQRQMIGNKPGKITGDAYRFSANIQAI